MNTVPSSRPLVARRGFAAAGVLGVALGVHPGVLGSLAGFGLIARRQG